MGPWLMIGMLNLISFFRGINLDNSPYKFGNGNLWRVLGPLGFFLGLLISGNEKAPLVPYIIGAVLNIAILISLLILG